MVTLTSDAPVIASFRRQGRPLRSRLISFAISLLILLGFVVFDLVRFPDKSLLAADRFHLVIWGIVIYGVYMLITLVGLGSKRPYLEFTADQFRFRAATGEPDPWWRDVKSIEEVGEGNGPKAVIINMTNGRNYRIDPHVIDFAGTDIAVLARQCWQCALGASE